MLDAIVETVPSLPPDEGGLARGVAVGRLAGVETKGDYVVASDSSILVLVDGSIPVMPGVTGAGCDVAFDIDQDARYKLRRAVLPVRLWADPAGATVQQLVSASPHASITPGKLSFFSVTGSGAAFALNCVAAVDAPLPEKRPGFGTSLATGDFDGDGNADLLVGAPGQHAYVYRGPFPAGGVPTPITIHDTSGIDFGYAVTALNVDGMPGDEALVADPHAKVGDQERAGRVTAFAWNAATSSMVAYKTYADHKPAANAK
ncbi:MAG: FG-GAP repeat protein, partial [Deltaproteobacteria bacterium]|nr:FG-GAP repeat protein [Deltaproteobacteria bacterium]